MRFYLIEHPRFLTFLLGLAKEKPKEKPVFLYGMFEEAITSSLASLSLQHPEGSPDPSPM